MFIGRNRLICVFKSFVPKNDALGDHITLFEPTYCDKTLFCCSLCTEELGVFMQKKFVRVSVCPVHFGSVKPESG